MQDEKSQLQNREKALRVLRARLYERALAEQQAELAADRRSQVGTGDRAEKIRTYNYGERRVTDHRIKLTVHNLDQVLEGELDELTAALQADEKRRRLEAQAARVSARHRRARSSARHGRSDALDGAITAIAAAGCESPRLDAEVLLAHVLGVGRERLLIDRELTVAGPRRARLPGRGAPPRDRARAGRLHHRTPRLSPLELAVDARALVPRPETELLVEVGLRAGRRRARARPRHRQRRGRAGAQARAPRPGVSRQRRQRGGARAGAAPTRGASGWRCAGCGRIC